MKKIISLLLLLSFNAFASENYKCYDIQVGSEAIDTSMTLSTGLFSGKITSVKIISEIKAGITKEIENPFTTVDASYYNLNQDDVKEASKMKFQEIRKNAESKTSVSLSESLLRLEKTGFAHYYSYSCFWILDCYTTSKYFKCDKI